MASSVFIAIFFLNILSGSGLEICIINLRVRNALGYCCHFNGQISHTKADTVVALAKMVGVVRQPSKSSPHMFVNHVRLKKLMNAEAQITGH